VLTDKSVRDLLAAFASSDPTPGGGSASALASAVGASLLMMVSALPKTRSGSDEDRVALNAASNALVSIQQQLVEAIDADSLAYDSVVAAYKLPKNDEGEQAARKTAIQRALRAATDVPLGVMRLSVVALRQARAVAEHGHRPAASDVGVGATLLAAGARGARLNVDINLGSLTDRSYVEAVKVESERLAKDAAEIADAVHASLRRERLDF
jgi:formiminotetrahydrofolate cyclodeaminase